MPRLCISFMLISYIYGSLHIMKFQFRILLKYLGWKPSVIIKNRSEIGFTSKFHVHQDLFAKSFKGGNQSRRPKFECFFFLTEKEYLESFKLAGYFIFILNQTFKFFVARSGGDHWRTPSELTAGATPWGHSFDLKSLIFLSFISNIFSKNMNQTLTERVEN